jgi:hypothetical protein
MRLVLKSLSKIIYFILTHPCTPSPPEEGKIRSPLACPPDASGGRGDLGVCYFIYINLLLIFNSQPQSVFKVQIFVKPKIVKITALINR